MIQILVIFKNKNTCHLFFFFFFKNNNQLESKKEDKIPKTTPFDTPIVTGFLINLPTVK